MIITRLAGGLGNQLFQYAMARRLAVHHGAELLVYASSYGPDGDLRPKELATFKRSFELFLFYVKARLALPNEIASVRDDFYRATTRDRLIRQIRRARPGFLWNSRHYVERQYRFQPEALDWPDNIYLQGYWQSPKYFDDIAPLIRQELEVRDASVTESAKGAVKRLKAHFPEVVSLHVRRGDLAHASEVLGRSDITHAAPVTLGYISQAIREFSPEACIFVFSDSPNDIAWCRNNIRAKNVEFSSAESSLWDFVAMSECDHHIIANSTFSWWAAWLDAKPARRVIAPRIWAHLEAHEAMPIEDLLPPDWQTI